MVLRSTAMSFLGIGSRIALPDALLNTALDRSKPNKIAFTTNTNILLRHFS